MEIENIRRGSGMWSEAGVPHKGWINVGLEDLGAERKICEMCRKTEIRYVHLMQHPQYPILLSVGCVCAGHLESDYIAAEIRERTLKSRDAKRKRWISLKWKISKKGQFYIKKDGFSVIILDKTGCFIGMIIHDASGSKFWTRNFKDVDEAKLLCFDRISSAMTLFQLIFKVG